MSVRALPLALALCGCWTQVALVALPSPDRDATVRDASAEVSIDTVEISVEQDVQAEAEAQVDAEAPTDMASCANGQTRCGDACVRMSEDPHHCGGCDTQCHTGYPCLDGRCGEQIVEMSVGSGHICVVHHSGEIVCWGYNDSGQLGDGRTRSRYVPAAVEGLRDADMVVAGENHTCARSIGGDHMYCWGDNDSGQLGTGNLQSVALPSEVWTVGTVRQIGVGLHFSCAINAAGQLWCWGQNSRGMLANEGIDNVLLPTRVDDFFNASRLGCGSQHACALRAGHVWCWGDNNYGQLGLGYVGTAARTPRLVPRFEDVREVGAGELHTCALVREGGVVWCWGYNAGGQLGNGTREPSSSPVRVSLPPNIQQLAVAPGQNFACALDADGSVWCWGANHSGQLGRGSITPFPGFEAPGLVDLGGRRMRMVRAGGSRACALEDRSNTLWCWGSNGSGELGIPPELMRAVSTPIEVNHLVMPE